MHPVERYIIEKERAHLLELLRTVTILLTSSLRNHGSWSFRSPKTQFKHASRVFQDTLQKLRKREFLNISHFLSISYPSSQRVEHIWYQGHIKLLFIETGGYSVKLKLLRVGGSSYESLTIRPFILPGEIIYRILIWVQRERHIRWIKKTKFL